MFSYPSFDEVAEKLGDKVISGISSSAASTAADLREYRRLAPLWVARSSERGLAAWIHDRMWDHVVGQLEEHSDVTVVDREPVREIGVSWHASTPTRLEEVHFRLRVKRHHPSGSVSTYPTPAALDFLAQQQPMFEGLEEIRLITGYLWDSDLRQVGVPVISLRNGRDKIVWMEELPPTADGGEGTLDLTPPPVTGPIAPVVAVNRPSYEEGESE
jgi:hypothetical protein